jgi:excisionase family DNA binding protein
MAMNRYEVLERLSELLAQEASEPIRSHSQARVPDVSQLPATVRPASVESKIPAPSLLLTVPEACGELRISRAQLYILVNKQHAIEMVHIGKLARIPRASLEDYVASLGKQNRLAFDRELCA